jgi:outer membrane protein TolC
MVKPMPNHLRRRTLEQRVIFVSTVLGLVSIAFAHSAHAMQAEANAKQSVSTAPLTLTLQDAIARARKNDPEYRAAVTEYGLAKEDRVQGRAALLPSANYSAALLYTQGNGTSTGRFVGANGVHEYVSQGNIHQDISLQGIADYGRARAAEAVARARSEIVARGLIVTVVQAYYHLVVAERKYSTAQRAATERASAFSISARSSSKAARSRTRTWSRHRSSFSNNGATSRKRSWK